MYLRKCLIASIFLLFSPFLFAQEEVIPEEIITDRPDQTEAPNLLSQGFLQIETGVLFEKYSQEADFSEVFAYNTTLLRYGLLENLELRLGIDYLKTRTNLSDDFSKDIKGFSPLLLGAKIGIVDENGLMPQIGFIGHLHLPFTAAKDFKPETTGVDFRFAFSHQLSNSSNLSYNVGAEWMDDDPEANYIYTLAYGYSISKSLGFYAEVYGDFPENNVANHNWDGGLTYLVKDNLQLDIFIGSGIDNFQQLLLGGGVSFRLPK